MLIPDITDPVYQVNVTIITKQEISNMN